MTIRDDIRNARDLAAFIREYHDNDRQAIAEMAEHGIASGCGPVYTSDQIAIYEEFDTEIDELCANMADDMGHETVAEWLVSLGSFISMDTPNDMAALMAVVAMEETAHRLADDDAEWESSDYDGEDGPTWLDIADTYCQ